MIRWLVVLSVWLIVANGATYLLFVIDKTKARVGARRIPEAVLLRAAFLGGTPAAYHARDFLRHKTRKEPFNRQLRAIARFHMALVLFGLLFLGWAIFLA